ncbi:MAG: carbamoyl-phosphate synthase domain-containing protein, partial [Actinomycetota bacterium]
MGDALLVLEDGTAFRGRSFGARGTTTGEAVFNTSMSGYQEVLTDPSYHGQLVTMTYPHIGNYGVNGEDVESSRVRVAGFVVREAVRTYSNHRATGSLHDYLTDAGIVGIEDVDTRRLTRHIRSLGAM